MRILNASVHSPIRIRCIARPLRDDGVERQVELSANSTDYLDEVFLNNVMYQHRRMWLERATCPFTLLTDASLRDDLWKRPF